MVSSHQPPAPEPHNIKFAAIDIGTNAVRLLLSRVLKEGDEPLIKKETLVRMPIRLGDDVFATGVVSQIKRRRLLSTMTAYRHLIDAYDAVDYIACATSAMREAENGAEVVDEIRQQTGIDLNIIDGRREAEIICQNRPLDDSVEKSAFLYVDVGGGSTEVVVFVDNHVVEANSFEIGGVRILVDRVDKTQWKVMKDWIKSKTKPYGSLLAIGSGGNINKAFRLARKKDGEAISYKRLRSIFKDLSRYSYEDLLQLFRMRPDRADVIVPALDIYLSVMKWARVKEMVVPLKGLSDGLVHLLYDKYRRDGLEPGESPAATESGPPRF